MKEKVLLQETFISYWNASVASGSHRISRKIPDAQGLSDEKLRFERFKHTTEKLKHMTGVDISKNRFENEEEAQAFFENLGFSVEQHSSLEVIDELVSPQKWNLNPEEVEKIARFMTVFLTEIKPPKS